MRNAARMAIITVKVRNFFISITQDFVEILCRPSWATSLTLLDSMEFSKQEK